MRSKILCVIGTRPEAIKMAPVVHALRRRKVQAVVCLSGQHREMLGGILPQLRLEADVELAPRDADLGLEAMAAAIGRGVGEVLAAVRPDRLLVQGDTTTALAATRAAAAAQVPVGHVEAGLRTFDLARPWPEEANRIAIDAACDLLFAPTAQARDNLRAERLGGRILLTGNTGIDALETAARRLRADPDLRAGIDAGLPPLAPGKRLVLVTGHRRETLGEGLLNVCQALARLSAREDVEVLYALHLNPQVQGPVARALGGRPNVHLAPPQSYLAFVRLLQRAHLVITDSGGVQEEAPALGKPLLVTRTETERPEAVAVGAAELVGTDADRIVGAAAALLDEPALYRRRAVRRLPFGDGRAAGRIAAALLGLEVAEFQAPEPAATRLADGVRATEGRRRVFPA